MSARQPAGDVPRQHYAEVSHELVLRTQNAVDAVERNCLDENASCGRPHDVCGGIIGAAGSFVPNEIAKFVLVLAPMVAATIISTVLSWRWYRAEQQ